MRCEFLGYYCSYGNYTHGCLQTLMPSKILENKVIGYFQLYDRSIYKTITTFGEERGLNLTYSASSITSGTDIFKVSNYKYNVSTLAAGREGSVPFCRIGSSGSCLLCQIGYLLLKSISFEDRCVLTCPMGTFPELTKTPLVNSDRMNILN